MIESLVSTYLLCSSKSTILTLPTALEFATSGTVGWASAMSGYDAKASFVLSIYQGFRYSVLVEPQRGTADLGSPLA